MDKDELSGKRRGRRSTDDIDPVIELFVREQVIEVGQALRSEFTAALTGMTNKISELSLTLAERDRRAAEDTARLEQKIGAVQATGSTNTAVATALEKVRITNRNWMVTLAGLIVATAGVLLAYLH